MQTAANIPLTGLATVLANPADREGGFVNARIVVPDQAGREEIGAASAVSARLGFNMTGMMLPPVSRASELGPADTRPLILIGANQPKMPSAIAVRVKTLKEHQGLVAWANGAVVIAGSTPTGTRVAAEGFAGRSPYLWDLPGKDTSATFVRVAADLRAVLQAAAVEVRSISFDEIVFEHRRDDAVSATMTADIANGTLENARRALQALADRHVQGQDVARLNYSGVAQLIVRLRDGGSTAAVTIPRVGT